MAGDLALCNCLVVDQNMPGLSGLDLITLLRAGHFAGTGDPDYEPPQLSVQERAEKAGIPIVEKPLLGNARPTSLQVQEIDSSAGTLHRHSGSVRNVTRSRTGSRGLPIKPPPSQVIASTPGMTDIALSAALNTSHVRCPHHARAG